MYCMFIKYFYYNTIIGTISNNIPTIVTDTKKKFLELTPVLFCISFNK